MIYHINIDFDVRCVDSFKFLFFTSKRLQIRNRNISPKEFSPIHQPDHHRLNKGIRYSVVFLKKSRSNVCRGTEQIDVDYKQNLDNGWRQTSLTTSHLLFTTNWEVLMYIISLSIFIFHFGLKPEYKIQKNSAKFNSQKYLNIFKYLKFQFSTPQSDTIYSFIFEYKITRQPKSMIIFIRINHVSAAWCK